MRAIITACLFIIATSIYPAGQLEDGPTPPQTPLAKAFGQAKADALGASKLTDAEQMQWLAVLRSVSGGTLEISAVSYMQNEGWKEVTFRGSAERDYKTFYVFDLGGFSRSYAVEKPFGLTLRPGKYFAKTKSIIGGLDSLIDANGREHRFHFAEWIELER
jgi:hypothetical protein